MVNQRLFVGCCLAPGQAEKVASWASVVLAGRPLRLIAASDLHVTLLFYPSVSDSLRSSMLDLVSQIPWSPLSVSTGRLVRMGANAVSLELNADISECKQFLGSPAYRQLESYLEEPERRRSLRFHLTVARVRGKEKFPLPKARFPLSHLTLDRVALFESAPQPDGTLYRIL